MTHSELGPRPPTFHAPAERAAAEDLRRAGDALALDPSASAFLEAMPGLALVLNAQRQVVAANRRTLEALGAASAEDVIGWRPGELLGCLHAEEGPGGCGTGRHCPACGAVEAVLACQRTGRSAAGECRLLTDRGPDGGALDVFVHATAVRLGGEDLTVVAMTDISGDKRRRVLERLFFHDVLNAAGGIRGLSELMLAAGEGPEALAYLPGLARVAADLVDQIQGHRQMLEAERGELEVRPREVAAADLAAEVVAAWQHHVVARERVLRLGRADPVVLHTDPVLLRRVLGNLVKNALEATPRGGAVTLEVRRRPTGGADLSVHNPGVMPEAVQRQIFHRSFSTKGGDGRGLGTHSVRLFTERHLGGRAAFTSSQPEGTVFTVSLPENLGGEPRQEQRPPPW